MDISRIAEAELPFQPDVLAVACPSRQVLAHLTSRWSLLVLLALRGGTLRFGALKRRIGGISERMLSQTLTVLEGDGFVVRRALEVVPPHVEYRLTDLGLGLGGAFCGVWCWAEENLARIEAARAAFDAR